MARSGGAPFSLGLKGNKQEHSTNWISQNMQCGHNSKIICINHNKHAWHHTYWLPAIHEHFRSRLTLRIVKGLVSTWYKQNIKLHTSFHQKLFVFHFRLSPKDSFLLDPRARNLVHLKYLHVVVGIAEESVLPFVHTVAVLFVRAVSLPKKYQATFKTQVTSFLHVNCKLTTNFHSSLKNRHPS